MAAAKTERDESDAAEFAQEIRARMPPVPVPGLGDIRIHRAAPWSGLAAFTRHDPRNAPYWAYPWPGGVALARHVLDAPASVAGRTVLDLGCGCGVVAIAAAKAGAGTVIAADVDPLALLAADVNADENGASIETRRLDLRTEPCPAVDIVFAGDVFYDRRLARRSLAFLRAAAARNIDVLVGDPGRSHLPAEHLLRVAEYRVDEVGALPGARAFTAGVFRLVA